MPEYIDWKAALSLDLCIGINCLDCPFEIDSTHSASGCKVEDFMKAIPSADVVEVRHGCWIWLEEDEDDFETDIVECSYCGKSYATHFSKESFLKHSNFVRSEEHTSELQSR